jgi:hypothetical protein
VNCLECALKGREAPAVGACRDCGAGACLDHAVVRERHLTRTISIALEVEVEPPARIVRCGACTAAVDAVRESSRPRGRHRSERAIH